jgi:DinB superfamily
MEAGELLRLAFGELHAALRDDLGSVGEATLFWQPGEGINHAGFLLWHLLRDEDTVVSRALREAPELWATGGWAGRLGLDEVGQGTGFDARSLASFRYDVDELWRYAAEVWEQTDAALTELCPEAFDDPARASVLTTGCLAHGWVHLGEIRQLLGLRGWRFRE